MGEAALLRIALEASRAETAEMETSKETSEQLQRRRRQLLAQATPGEGVQARIVFHGDRPVDIPLKLQCRACSGTGSAPSLLSADVCADMLARLDSTTLAGYQCGVCYGDGEFHVSAACFGHHYFCADCIVGTLTAMLESGQFPLHCPGCRSEATTVAGSNEESPGLCS